MIRYVNAHDLFQFPKLAQTMFTDRALQFRRRLNWNVSVDRSGFERDVYDTLDPLYVIWEKTDGTHGGSFRLLPTTGRTMVNDCFRDLCGNVEIRSPFIWECTRFCLSPNADSRVSAALMLAGSEVLRGFGLKHFVGVFDARMLKVYKSIGSYPDVIGSSDNSPRATCVGLWEFDPCAQEVISKVSQISINQSRTWFERAFFTRDTNFLRAAG